jgi:polyhydroxybutyrate depolymerase
MIPSNLLFTLTPLVLASCAGRTFAAPVSGMLSFGGVERHFIYVVPAAYDGKTPVPVVLIFHGAGNTGALMESTLGFTELQSRKCFLAVYPDGIDKAWNGGREEPTTLESARSDDVGFVSALIDAMGAKFKVDPKRIYATGSSNGAIFCETLAVRLSERIAAIGPVNGTLGPSVSGKFPLKHPVSVISFNGTADPFVPFMGVEIPGHKLLSAPDTIAFWVKADACDTAPSVTEIPKAVPDDGTAVRRLDFANGRDGTEVVAYIIAHGGHTWPGFHTYPGWAKLAGKTAMSVNATEAIWDFFANHPKM